jgi:hypothetical protein
MINGFVRFALGVAQMPEATVNDLDKSLPGFSNIAAAFKELEPILTKANPHIQALEPLIIQAMPIIQKVWPDIIAVTPTVEELIAFVNSKTS